MMNPDHATDHDPINAASLTVVSNPSGVVLASNVKNSDDVVFVKAGLNRDPEYGYFTQSISNVCN